MTGEPAWQQASAQLEEMHRIAEAATVLRTATRAGILAALRTPVTTDDIATGAGIATSRAAALLEVLRSLGVATETGGRWSLTPGWADIVDGAAPFDLEAVVETHRIRATQFEQSVGGGSDYATLNPADRLAVARGVSFNPAAKPVQAMLRRDLELLDGVVPALEAGGRVLELGCGVGSRLTALAIAFPRVQAVGVELDPELAAYGRERAAKLGVGDRVTYVVEDATTFSPVGAYDLVNWSQFFFPAPTRVGAVATARKALRAGGWISAPVIWGDEPVEAASTAAQELALEGLMLDIWDVPRCTTADVEAEFRAAGFVDTRVAATPYVNLVRARQP